MGSEIKVRRSITELQDSYDRGDKLPLETLMRAWKGIKELPPTDENSFFVLGGFHGEPFRGPGASDGAWWGGYCQHGTVLFPTWHRVYLHKLEKALQSIEGCADVTLPFWDECSEYSKHHGIPWALTRLHFELDGKTIDNPLRSFVLPLDIYDMVATDQNDDPTSQSYNPNYSKPKGYETVRYPLSGLVGTMPDQFRTAQHNAGFPNREANILTLDANIMTWLTLPVVSGGKTRGLIDSQFEACLKAPTYTLFSNTTSMKNWNDKNPPNPPTDPTNQVMALESPHNYMHLAVGGFDIPSYDASPIEGANGDMGENDTAGLDPIFYFHHCFIDYAFWTWQRIHGATHAFTIDPDDPGASYANNQPPAGADPTAKMSLETPLNPFAFDDKRTFTSADCIDIEGQLHYTYGPGSLDKYLNPKDAAPAVAALAADETARLAVAEATPATRTVRVSGLDRSKIAGSFLVAVYTEQNGKHVLAGVEPVLSRWNVGGCSNCQSHLKVTASFHVPAETHRRDNVKVLVHTRNGVLGDAPTMMKSAGGVVARSGRAPGTFKVEML